MDSFVKVDADGYATCDVVAEEAQFRFGGSHSTGLTLVLTEPSLERLVAVATEALRTMRTQKFDSRTATPVA